MYYHSSHLSCHFVRKPKSASKIRLVRWPVLLETRASRLPTTRYAASRSQWARKRLADYMHPVSEWVEVISGVPRGSVLGPLLFLIYINDLDEDIKSLILKFADDIKIFWKIVSEEDSCQLQNDLDVLLQWAEDWQMSSNIAKCKVIHIGNRNLPLACYYMNGREICRCNGYNAEVGSCEFF